MIYFGSNIVSSLMAVDLDTVDSHRIKKEAAKVVIENNKLTKVTITEDENSTPIKLAEAPDQLGPKTKKILNKKEVSKLLNII